MLANILLKLLSKGTALTKGTFPGLILRSSKNIRWTAEEPLLAHRRIFPEFLIQ
jgi:hypothetical protein